MLIAARVLIWFFNSLGEWVTRWPRLAAALLMTSLVVYAATLGR